MQAQHQPQISNTSAAIQAVCPETQPTLSRASWQEAPPPLFTVGQFAERNPAFTQAALRNLIFKADERHASNGVIPGNGLIEAGAIVRLGRKVMLHESRFFAWIEQQARGQK